MSIIFYLMSFICGITMTIQSAINTQLKSDVKNPWLSSFISFLVGTIILGIVVLAVQKPVPSFAELRNLEWYKYLGGILGAYFVTAVIFAIPQIGPAAMFGLIIAGQMTSAALFEQFGWLGIKHNPVTVIKAIGIILLIAGAFLVNKK